MRTACVLLIAIALMATALCIRSAKGTLTVRDGSVLRLWLPARTATGRRRYCPLDLIHLHKKELRKSPQ